MASRRRSEEVAPGHSRLAREDAVGGEAHRGRAHAALHRLQFIGCGGLAVMVAAADRAGATGDRFRVTRGSPAIDRLLSLTGFEHRFEMTTSEAQVERRRIESTAARPR